MPLVDIAGSFVFELAVRCVRMIPQAVAICKDGKHAANARLCINTRRSSLPRARSLSVYRFWRDLGYAIGAPPLALSLDIFGFIRAIIEIGALSFISGAVVVITTDERGPDEEIVARGISPIARAKNGNTASQFKLDAHFYAWRHGMCAKSARNLPFLSWFRDRDTFGADPSERLLA